MRERRKNEKNRRGELEQQKKCMKGESLREQERRDQSVW